MKYNIIFWLGVAVFVLENTYFGWNVTAQSGWERVWDAVTTFLLFIGAVGGVAYQAGLDAAKKSVD